MADLDDIFDDNWEDSNVDKPYIGRAEFMSVTVYRRSVICRLVRQRENYMGILNRDKYTPESHNAWIVRIVSDNQTDAENMIKETRRICAKYNGTSGEDKYITWEVGDWETRLPHRWTFRFVVMVQKAGIDLGFS